MTLIINTSAVTTHELNSNSLYNIPLQKEINSQMNHEHSHKVTPSIHSNAYDRALRNINTHFYFCVYVK